MKTYDREEPLFSLHIPKCAGTSLKPVLQNWFGERFYTHYFEERLNRMPPQHPLGAGSCIHGHFNRSRKFGILDYYPNATQLITIMREPFQVEVSLYFYLKGLGENVFRDGKPNPMQTPNIADFLRGRSSYVREHIPYDLTLDNCREILEKHFIYIGVAEDLQTSVNVLAGKLGFEPMKIERLNVSQHDEEVPGDLREEYMSRHPLEYTIYQYALEHYGR